MSATRTIVPGPPSTPPPPPRVETPLPPALDTLIHSSERDTVKPPRRGKKP